MLPMLRLLTQTLQYPECMTPFSKQFKMSDLHAFRQESDFVSQERSDADRALPDADGIRFEASRHYLEK